MGAKRFLEGQVADTVAVGIVVEQAVEADALDGSNESAQRCLGLQAAAGADAHKGQAAKPVAVLSRGEINVGQSVQFVDHDVDVVATDAGGERREAFPVISACDAVELTAAHLALHVVEMGCHHCHATGVADKDDAVGQLLGAQMKVEDAAVFVDDEFGRSVFHGGEGEKGCYAICPAKPCGWPSPEHGDCSRPAPRRPQGPGVGWPCATSGQERRRHSGVACRPDADGCLAASCCF